MRYWLCFFLALVGIIEFILRFFLVLVIVLGCLTLVGCLVLLYLDTAGIDFTDILSCRSWELAAAVADKEPKTLK